MLIFGGSASEVLAIKVARELGQEVSRLEIKRFPDGEKYIRVLDDVAGKDIFLIQSIYHKPDEYLLEFLFLVNTLKDLEARKVTAVVPYFAYARQDQRFNPGESVSFEIVTKLIEHAGTDEIYTIDMHLHRVPDISRIFKIPARNLSATLLLAKYVKENFTLKNPLVIGPDEEAQQWACMAAKELNTEYDILEKRRLGPEKVEIKPKELDARNRDIVIIDDIISTGGTILEAVRGLRKEGATNILVACTHPVLVENALAKIYQAGAYSVIGTDTIPSPISYVSVSPLIAEICRRRG